MPDLRIIGVGAANASEEDARRDGAPADRESRQRQRAEFAELLTRTWPSSRPFHHDGEFHQVAARHDGTYLTTGAASVPSGVRRALRLRAIVAATRWHPPTDVVAYGQVIAALRGTALPDRKTA